MGYRSEVVLAVSKEVLPQFLVTLAKSPETRVMCYQHTDRRVDDYDGEGGVLFHWECVKWYEGYEEVAAVQDFMDWCDSETVATGSKNKDGTPCSPMPADEFYRFVRLGEGLEDPAEVRGCGFQDLRVNRSVVY
jgi:hypothetical protein